MGQESGLMRGVSLLRPHFRGRLGWHLSHLDFSSGGILSQAHLCGAWQDLFWSLDWGRQFPAGCCPEGAIHFLACEPPHMATWFIKGSKTESLLARGRSQRRRLLTKVTAHPFCHIVWLQVLPTHMGRVLHEGVNRRRGRPWRPSWSLSVHQNVDVNSTHSV